MSRAAVYSLLSSSSELAALGFTGGSIYRSVSAESPEQRPFMVLRWGNETPAFGTTGTEFLTVWVYDEPGDYGRIDSALLAIRNVLTSAVQVAGTDNKILTQADWSGNSEDLYDDMFACITKNSLYTVVSRSN
jgi:hypothetical protein